MTKSFVLAASWFLVCGAAIATAAPPPQTETEVMHLLEFVQRSACEFNRNGTWYNGKEARLHLEKKYGALAARGLIGKAEDFIERAASKSSISGQNYKIRCQGGITTTSGRWLADELQRHRKDGKKK